jgi:hypothetical protein
MRIQQAEGGNLGKNSIVMRRQALKRTVVSLLWRDRLASILIVLLTETWLLGTPAFGDNWKEMMETMYYWSREAQEALASMNRCGLEFSPSDDQYLAKVRKCLKDRQPRFAEALRCIGPLEKNCGYAREPPKATAASQPAPRGRPRKPRPEAAEPSDG